MEIPVSAFEIYNKQAKRKRKIPPEPERVILQSKKKKHGTKDVKSNHKREFNNLSAELSHSDAKRHTNLNRKNTQIVSHENQDEDENGDGSTSSEEEIPTLVPMAEPSCVEKSKSKKHGTVKVDVANLPEVQTSNGENLSNSRKKKSKKPQLIPEISRESSSNSPREDVFNPVTQCLGIFKWLIDPISPREFFEKYWEEKVLYVKRPDRKYFNDVFSSEKLDSILREYPLHFTRNIDVVVYQNGKKEIMDEEGRVLPSKLWDFYNNGCSVRILNPQTYDQNVHSIISSLQEYFGTMVGANAYLTPPHSQGFAPHFDDIEAFIIQLEGSKYWKLYKPREEDVLARDSSHNFKAEDLDAPFMEVKLNPGDLLYFPRGTIHEGHTKDEHSLHITLSVYQHTAFVDLLEQTLPAALKKAATENIEYRRGLPLNYLKHLGVVNANDESDKRNHIINRVKLLVKSLVKYIDVDAAADNLGRKFMHDAMPPLYSQEEAQHSCKFDGDFMKNGIVYNRVEINPDIKIRLLRYYALRVVKESDTTAKLYFCTDNANTYHGEEEQWLELDKTLIPGVEMLQKKYPEFVAADDLPIKDDAEKLGLVSSLWEHGLLVTDGPLPNCDSDMNSDSDLSE